MSLTQRDAALASKESYEKSLAAKGCGKNISETADAGHIYFPESYRRQYLAKCSHGHCGLGGTGVNYQIATSAICCTKSSECWIAATVIVHSSHPLASVHWPSILCGRSGYLAEIVSWITCSTAGYSKPSDASLTTPSSARPVFGVF